MNPKNLTWLSKRCGGWGSSKIAPLGSTKHLPHPSPTKNKLNHQNHCCLLLTFSSATTTPGKSCNNMTVSEDTMTQSSISISKPFILGKLSYQSLSNEKISIWYIQNIQRYHPPSNPSLNFSKNTLFLTKKTYLTRCSNTIRVLLINESRLATLERFKKSTFEEAKVETLRWPGGGVDMINGNHGVFLTNNKKCSKKIKWLSDWKKNTWNTKSHQVIYSCTNTSWVLNILAQRFGS